MSGVARAAPHRLAADDLGAERMRMARAGRHRGAPLRVDPRRVDDGILELGGHLDHGSLLGHVRRTVRVAAMLPSLDHYPHMICPAGRETDVFDPAPQVGVSAEAGHDRLGESADVVENVESIHENVTVLS